MTMRLLAVDWGTSSLRGALLDAAGHVREERSFPRGIMTVPAGGFPDVFRDAFGDWAQQAPLALISGMAGSRQGWVEAPYCACPAGFGEIAARLTWVEPGRIAIVPGLSCENDGVPDVMRGEEAQVLGALQMLGLTDAVFVLPGTHSKWVRVRASRVESFRTFMTGEVYGLLRKHSILARGMPEQDGTLDEGAFRQGLRHAQRAGNLLHAAFSARTLALFERMPAELLPSYLSGLVIGEELRAVSPGAREGTGEGVVIIGTPELAARYTLAMPAARVAPPETTWRGLFALAQSMRP